MDTQRIDIHVSQAGNTIVPAILALEALGFQVEVSRELVMATRGDARYTADDPVAVLGLVKLVEDRGRNWRATDREIDETLARFDL